MMIESFKALFRRDLERLKEEINLFSDESTIWKVTGDIKNPAGNLCLHLVGNLNAYIGVGICNSGYIRNRELEFSLKYIPKNTLIQQVDDTIHVVMTGLDNLTDNHMERIFPINIWGKPTDFAYTLLELLAHLNYHLGQINYIRRMLESH